MPDQTPYPRSSLRAEAPKPVPHKPSGRSLARHDPQPEPPPECSRQKPHSESHHQLPASPRNGWELQVWGYRPPVVHLPHKERKPPELSAERRTRVPHPFAFFAKELALSLPKGWEAVPMAPSILIEEKGCSDSTQPRGHDSRNSSKVVPLMPYHGF